MPRLTVTSDSRRQIIDISEQVNNVLGESRVGEGLCHLFMQHTTAALTLAALEPGAADDLLMSLDQIIPHGPFSHEPPDHVPAHIASALIGVSVVVPISDAKLMLGEFQKLVLIELDGPRERYVEVRLNS